jgi:hypothetical protein
MLALWALYFAGGAVSALAFAQSNPTSVNDDSHFDISNAQMFLQKTDGLLRFFVQGGGFSIPALGASYFEADNTTNDAFGVIPVAYATLAPADNFSVMVGKLPTVIGAEYTFTFQNMNIQRGLLWNQENAVNRGVQANCSTGPIAASLSLNDGIYSEDFNWVSGLVSWTIDPNNVLTFAGGGSFDESTKSTFVTPLVQNNSSIYNIMYTHTAGDWTLAPYLQLSTVDADASLGIVDDAQTLGAAFLAKYQYSDTLSLAGRAEYIDSNGNTNLLYGTDSNAWSLTVTPTYQEGIFFARAEWSYVGAGDTSTGSAFGTTGNDDNQGRILLETGFLF